ncbi:MAG TPA: amidohydrolase [Solibacterales bacterium]|nr:amidohydrolase [Bryobacterales bacterium]
MPHKGQILPVSQWKPQTETAGRGANRRAAEAAAKSARRRAETLYPTGKPAMRTILSLWSLLLYASPLAAADLLLTNGRFWTGDAARPWVSTLAITGNRITGYDAEPSKQTIDLKGAFAMPGFNDAHIHFLSGSLGLFEVDLNGACSIGEIQKRVVEYARANPRQPWITGAGWEYSCIPGGLPRKEDLDAVVKDRPVWLRSYDGHSAWANSAALRTAGVTKGTAFDGFGEIVKDAKTGELTGAFKEAATRLVSRHIPPPDRARQLAAMRKGLELAASLGITSMQNASGDETLVSLYEELLAKNELTVRTSIAMWVGLERAEETCLRAADLWKKHRNDLLKVGAVKFPADGVIESYTAAMIEPYANKAGERGMLAWPESAFKKAVAACDAMGLQIYTHAIGDRGVRLALDAYEAVRRPGRDARHRVEHIETIHPDDVARFAKLGVLPSMQPIHADPGTIEVWSAAVGEKRLPLAFAWRSLEQSGARLVFASDWPAAISVDPIRGLHNAVNRRTTTGLPPGGWIPEQRVPVETALRAYTANGAYASFDEGRKGILRPGMLADVVVLSEDPTRIAPERLHEIRVRMTVFDGRVIYQRR